MTQISVYLDKLPSNILAGNGRTSSASVSAVYDTLNVFFAYDGPIVAFRSKAESHEAQFYSDARLNRLENPTIVTQESLSIRTHDSNFLWTTGDGNRAVIEVRTGPTFCIVRFIVNDEVDSATCFIHGVS